MAVPEGANSGEGDRGSPRGSVTRPGAAAIELDLYCQKCGYNLRGLTAERCPECGRSLEGLRSPVSRIPWVRRSEIGWLRAYWKTVWLVMFRQAAFCWEMARPVSYRDSQSFRWVTVLHAWLPIVAVTSIAFFPIAEELPALPFDWLEEAAIAKWPVGVFQVLTLLFLAAATGIPSYFFHSRSLSVEMQNRAIALSYYCAAPLAWMLVPIFLAIQAYLLAANELTGAMLANWSMAAFAAVTVGWWLLVVRLVRLLVPHHWLRALAIGVNVPILWFITGVVIYFGLPVLVAYVVLIVASFG